MTTQLPVQENELTTLHQHFTSQRATLKLPALLEPSQAVRTLAELLEPLRVADVNLRSPIERQVIQQGVDIILTTAGSIRTLQGEVQMQPVEVFSTQPPAGGAIPGGIRTLLIFQLATGLGLVTLLITLIQGRTLPAGLTGWLALAITLSVLLLLLLILIVLNLWPRPAGTGKPAAATLTPQVSCMVRRDPWLDAIGHALAALDEIVAIVRARPQAPAPLELAQQPDLLSALQTLAGAVLDGNATNALLWGQMLVARLADLGITTVVHTAPHASPAPHLFELQRGVGATQYETVVPALVQGERVLLRGRVEAPAPLVG